MDINLSPNLHNPLVNKFKSVLIHFSQLAKQCGIEVVPFQEDTLQRFIEMDFKKQTDIISRFAKYTDICDSAIKNQIALNDEKHSLAWWAMKKLKLRPPMDLFHHLDPEDVTEIYDSDGIQVFRSLSFFKLCIYSLDQILTHEWTELYKRDEKVTTDHIEMVTKLFTGKIEGVYFSNFPDHTVEQCLGPKATACNVYHKLIAPLKGEDGRTYLFNAFQITEAK